jgi:hypothetical protein
MLQRMLHNVMQQLLRILFLFFINNFNIYRPSHTPL